MIALSVSPRGLYTAQAQPDGRLVSALQRCSTISKIVIFSNKALPSWVGANFIGPQYTCKTEIGRQNGFALSQYAAANGMKPWDVIVLAVTQEDLQMGKNAGAIVLGASWATHPAIKALGIQVCSDVQLVDVVDIVGRWGSQWHVKASAPLYEIRSLCDLSTFYTTVAQQDFSHKVTHSVKQGDGNLNKLLTVTARSLLAETVPDDAMFAVYPSSNSKNIDDEVLSEFTHRLRTTVSRVHFAQKGQPLFIRHRPSVKRSSAGGVNRLDPADQVESIYLNPFYNGKISGRHVYVIDDCTTYGLSFGVAAAFLRAAGARAVTGIAMGKFGNQLRSFDIRITSNPFQPVPSGSWALNGCSLLPCIINNNAQASLRNIIP